MPGPVGALGGSSQPTLSIILRAEPAPGVVCPAEEMEQASPGGGGCLLAAHELSMEYRTAEESSRSPLRLLVPLPSVWLARALGLATLSPPGDHSPATERGLCAGHRGKDSTACVNSLKPLKSPLLLLLLWAEKLRGTAREGRRAHTA